MRWGLYAGGRVLGPARNAYFHAAYDGFYNQVRADFNAIANGKAAVRQQLSEHNFEKALILCDEYLAKYPNNTDFRVLKLDAQTRQRHALLVYITDIDRRVEAESDLDKRMSILREALGAY